ncbi:hypothetical protein LN042_11015 [Kitasatospora sp. RB6PN24]|uniref:hypothetical protein n=1 Tax=Kitasatospora humi TaxID=2893891 RepID=UPI001E54A01F|nr:hypothetical protein [Kitasatospora humi]MCC9307626.1 hypothetical protein [Kitasatospora humi]
MPQWRGVADREAYRESYLARRDQLADAAHRGEWTAVLAAADSPERANAHRVVGHSGQTHHITPDGCTLAEHGW